jgi:hypothetical protein
MDSPLTGQGLNRSMSRNRRSSTMKRTIVSLVFLALTTGTASAQEPTIGPVMTKDLANQPGKDVRDVHGGVSTRVGRPGASAQCPGFIYVLEGSIVMQVRGGQEVTLAPGQGFYEGPMDIHVVGRSVSTT